METYVILCNGFVESFGVLCEEFLKLALSRLPRKIPKKRLQKCISRPLKTPRYSKQRPVKIVSIFSVETFMRIHVETIFETSLEISVGSSVENPPP